MTLYEADGKNIKVALSSGKVITGIGDCYTPACDNPEGKESLCIENLMFFEDEVVSIEEIGE